MNVEFEFYKSEQLFKETQKLSLMCSKNLMITQTWKRTKGISIIINRQEYNSNSRSFILQ